MTENHDRYQMQALLSALQEADSVLLFSHVSPDGDTLGSALALKIALEGMRKRVTLALDAPVPEALSFLPDTYGFRAPADVAAHVALDDPGLLAVAVDVSSAERMGAGAALFSQAAHTAQLDHHETNPGFAQINVIDGDAPATALLVYRLLGLLGAPLQGDVAVCLYTALATDTGNFIYRNTNAEAFLMMADLMRAGLDVAAYGRLLFRRKSREHVALLGATLPTLRYLCGGEVAGMHVSYAQMRAVGASSEHAEGVVDYAIDLVGVKLAYFLREQENGRVKASLRALAPNRVDRAAARFGGGGHQLAAGCTLDLPLNEAVTAIEQVLAAEHRGEA